MRIYAEQVRALVQGSPALLGDWLFKHVHRFFPDTCATLGPDGVRAAVSAAMARAAAHGFVDPVQVGRFTDMVFAFGPAFDADPRFPWASAILGDPSPLAPAERFERLHRAALQFDTVREE